MADSQPAARGTRLFTSVLIAAVAAFLGFGAVYVMFQGPDNAAPTTQSAAAPPQRAEVAPATLPAGPGANPLSRGDMAAFVFKPAPEPLPEMSFVDGAGKSRSLKDWAGKVVLLNLWATWCAPCRKEMPALDRLQQELGGDGFEVVALAVDKAGIDGARKFLNEIKVENLALYADPDARAGTLLKVIGMPTTLLLDPEGREIGRLIGPAEWDGADAKRLVQAALKGQS